MVTLLQPAHRGCQIVNEDLHCDSARHEAGGFEIRLPLTVDCEM
jgi:hypothetical protein